MKRSQWRNSPTTWKVEDSFDDLDVQTQRVLRERHDRIKKELRTNLTALIGLAGSALVLSLTLLEKVAPQKLHLWILVMAWIFLGLTLVTSLAVLLNMTRRSIRFQNELKESYRKGTIKLLFHGGPSTPGGHFFEVVSEGVPGEVGTRLANILLVIGIVLLGCFAILNLFRK